MRPQGTQSLMNGPMLLCAIVAAAPITNLNYLQLIAFYAMGVSILRTLQLGTFRRPTRSEIGIVVFAGYALLSQFWAVAGSKASPVTVATEYAGLAVIFLLVKRSAGSTRAWRMIGGAYLVGCCVDIVLVIWNWQTGTALEGNNRYGIDGINANYTAYSLATAWPIALGLFWSSQRSRRALVLTFAFQGMVAIAIVLTGCRGAMLAYGLGLVVAAGILWRSKPLVGGAVVATLGAGLLSFGSQAADWLSTLLLLRNAANLNDFSSGRLDLWRQAPDIFSKNPIFGSGVDSYVSLSVEGVHAHNVFLSVLSELGIVGLGLLAVALLALWTGYFKRFAPRWSKWVAGVLIAEWIVIAMTGVWQYAPPAWIAFAWMAAVPDLNWGPGSDTHQLEPQAHAGAARV